MFSYLCVHVFDGSSSKADISEGVVLVLGRRAPRQPVSPEEAEKEVRRGSAGQGGECQGQKGEGNGLPWSNTNPHWRHTHTHTTP